MYCPLCRIPAFRRLRARLARIFALGVLALLVHGCDQPTAPNGDGVDPASPSGSAPSALVAPGNSRIAFLSYTNEESDIYTIAPGGGGLARLTSWAGSEWEPTWS